MLFYVEFNLFFIPNYFSSDHTTLIPTKFIPGKSRHAWAWLDTPVHTKTAKVVLYMLSSLGYYLYAKIVRH